MNTTSFEATWSGYVGKFGHVAPPNCNIPDVYSCNVDICENLWDLQTRIIMASGTGGLFVIGVIILFLNSWCRAYRFKKLQELSLRHKDVYELVPPRAITKAVLVQPNWGQRLAECNEVDEIVDKEYGFETHVYDADGNEIDVFKPMWTMPDPLQAPEAREKELLAFEDAMFGEEYQRDMDDMLAHIKKIDHPEPKVIQVKKTSLKMKT